jgi:hypothetical protein
MYFFRNKVSLIRIKNNKTDEETDNKFHIQSAKLENYSEITNLNCIIFYYKADCELKSNDFPNFGIS